MSFQRNLLLFLFIIILEFPSVAQKSKQYAPIGAVWGYSFRDLSCFPGCKGGWVDEVDRDTIISGQRFAVITRSNYYNTKHVGTDTVYRGIINDSLFEIKNGETEFLLDFSWDYSDTVLLIGKSHSKIDSLSVSFFAKDSIFSGSDTLKIISPTISPTQNPVRGWGLGTIIANIGSMSHKLSYDDGARDGVMIPKFSCYEEPSGFKITDSPSKSCKANIEDWIALTIHNIQASNSYYVKTINSKLILSNKESTEVEEGDLIIRNVQGQIVLSKEMYTLDSQVDIPRLTNGIYFLEFNLSKNQKVSLKFIVSE